MPSASSSTPVPAAGSGLPFEGSWPHELTSVPGEWRLYAVTVARDAYIVDAVRSPIGRRNGSLSEIRAEELAAQVMNGLLDRLDVEPGEIEDV
ncbi:MAG: hypothetical protein M3Q59_09770, partial [Actinomycetota bacterium]|nr:hypothetical protein [Actinomycetota bacterium]